MWRTLPNGAMGYTLAKSKLALRRHGGKAHVHRRRATKAEGVKPKGEECKV